MIDTDMHAKPTRYVSKINELIEIYGNFDFLAEAVKNPDATAKIILNTEVKLFAGAIFFYLLSIGTILLGLSGLLSFVPKESVFLAPIGIGIFYITRGQVNKRVEALKHLSKIARAFEKT